MEKDAGKIPEIIFVQLDEAESGVIEKVIILFHAHAFQHRLIVIDVELVVSQYEIAGQGKFLVLADQLRARGRLMAEVSQMEQKGTVAFHGAFLRKRARAGENTTTGPGNPPRIFSPPAAFAASAPALQSRPEFVS